MSTIDTLRVGGGVTSVVGSGGKSAALALFARELTGTVVLATTTHFRPFRGIPTLLDPTPSEVEKALASHRVVCVGSPAADRKLGPCALAPLELAGIADHVIVEADGSKRLPLKAHASYEPVIPDGTSNTILVVGASGFDRPVRKVVHRPELFCERAGCDPRDKASAELVARVALAELEMTRPNTVLVNQVETVLDRMQAIVFAQAYGHRCVSGSLRSHELEVLLP